MVKFLNYPKRQLKNLVHKGDYKEALILGKKLTEKNPQDADLFFMMGSIYYMLGEAKNALEYFDKSLAIEEDKETLLFKANLHLYLKEKEPAIECCNKIFEMDPKNKDADEILNKLAEL